MYDYTWYQWILFFYVYCFLGWIIESTYVSCVQRQLVNRGFLRLPLLPLYGSGAILMLWVSLPLQDNLILVFLAGMIAASALEYVTGYVMERLFKMKYWDYSDQPLNLNGYICLWTSVCWGGLTILLTELIHRPIARVVLAIPSGAAIVFGVLISLVFAADVVQSVKAALDLGRVLENMTKLKTELEEMQLQMALLKAETVQKVSDMKEETIQRAANIKGETSVMITTLKAENAARKNEAVQSMKESVKRQAAAVSALRETAGKSFSDLSGLSERLQLLTEKRDNLATHLSFYRKGLLRGNPTASSKQFGEALKELKSYAQKKKNGGKTSN